MRTTIACLLLCAANAGTSPEGRTWLEAKAKEDGVVTLESGLMYKVLRDGDGENHPKASTSCECHYEGKLIDGTVFDSSVDRGTPLEFRLGRGDVIRGWDEGLAHGMRVGGRRQLVIPPELGYGARGAPPAIPPNALLHFDVELVSIGGSVWTKIASLAKGFMK